MYLFVSICHCLAYLGPESLAEFRKVPGLDGQKGGGLRKVTTEKYPYLSLFCTQAILQHHSHPLLQKAYAFALHLLSYSCAILGKAFEGSWTDSWWSYTINILYYMERHCSALGLGEQEVLTKSCQAKLPGWAQGTETHSLGCDTLKSYVQPQCSQLSPWKGGPGWSFWPEWQESLMH